MRYRILVIETHPLLLTDTSHLLASLGPHTVDGVSSGAEALRVLQDASYDLVISDLHLPDMDVLTIIELWPEHAPCTALALSSTNSALTIRKGASQAAKSRGIAVLGTYTKPLTQRCAKTLLHTLRAHKHHATHTNQPCHTHSKQQLLNALTTHAIQAWYQPQYSLGQQAVVGVEALVRWAHPQLGLLAPDVFLKDIERESLHEALLYSMLEQSITAQKKWKTLGHSLRISVNLHTRLLDDLSLAARLFECVRDLGAYPASICFELTEHSNTMNTSHYYTGATRLRMKGFALAQDDFSTGYSSFFRLLSTPFTELKLDRALVQHALHDARFRTALSHLIKLGNEMGLSVVAEGVETMLESDFLYRLGCDIIQGFAISPAIPCHSLTALLATAVQHPVRMPRPPTAIDDRKHLT